ncbi:porin [Methylomonas montana]|uniref:OprO/OprP family phosphate-selective porin n=1 Tax=Methylomonas montana TaxID=3058963 RepID=UPI002658FCA3|nr:porin [Methylomonas montana]WKJ91425.1 porin [Methylomonas montana]
MKNYRRKTLISAINLALLGVPAAHAASTDALEQRIRELESRLEKFEKAASVAEQATTTAQPSAEVEKLNRKINTLERKLEVDKEVATAAASRTPKVEAASDGFRISSPDNKHQVRIRGAVQTDARFFTGGSTPTTDKFELKQARIWLEGKFWDKLYFKIMPDFAANNILPDAYVDYAYLPYASLSVGKQKTPISLERLQGDADGMFLERAFPTYLASNRDVGVMLHGSFAKPGYKADYAGPVDFRNFISYQLGVFNGSGDDGSPDKNSPDTDDPKEFAGRLWVHPFQHGGNSWLEGLGLGLAGSWERPQRQALKNQGTPIGRTTFLNYGSLRNAAQTALIADGAHYRIYPQAYWYAGPFGVMGEYALSAQEVVNSAGAPVRNQINNTAWQVQLSYVLTGEDNTFQSVKPMRPFDPLAGSWGAFQVAGRFSEFHVDDKAFLYLDPSRSARNATAWAVGVNWFINQNARIMADYEQTYFDGGAGTAALVANRPSENVFATRFQLAF